MHSESIALGGAVLAGVILHNELTQLGISGGAHCPCVSGCHRVFLCDRLSVKFAGVVCGQDAGDGWCSDGSEL